MTFIMATLISIRDIPKNHLKETRTAIRLSDGIKECNTFSLHRAETCLVKPRISNRWLFPKELF